MWTDMFLSDGLRPAKESLGALRVGPRQPRRLSEREYALYYRCAQCANVWAIQKPTAQSPRVHPWGIP